MSSFALTLYVLIWPAIAAVVMIILCVSLFRHYREDRRECAEVV